MRSKQRRRQWRGASADPLTPAGLAPGEVTDVDAVADLLFGASAPPAAVTASGDFKLEQLCAQVAEALALALASAGNPLLRELRVEAVAPIRGAARLEVRLEAEPDVEPRAAERAVARALGWLRSEVAEVIARKRVPELAVVVVPAVAAGESLDEEDFT